MRTAILNGPTILTQWEYCLIPTVRQVEEIAHYAHDDHRTASLQFCDRYFNPECKIVRIEIDVMRVLKELLSQ